MFGRRLIVNMFSMKKKKIVFISDLDFRFQANHPLELAEVFARFGFDVSMIAPIPDDIAHLNSQRGYKIISLFSKGKSLGNAGFVFRALYEAVRIAPYLVVGVNPGGFIPAWLTSIMIRKVKLVYWPMELSRLSEGVKGFSTRFQTRFARHAEMVWSTGVERAQVMQSDWMLQDQPYVLPNTLTQRPQLKDDGFLARVNHLQPDDLIVLYASSLSPLTAVPELIDSVRFWNQRAKLVIAGYGSDAFINEMKRKIKESNLQERIQYLGTFQTKDEVLSFLTHASLGFVLKMHHGENSLNLAYYTPSKLFECAAYGVPVICSDNPSLYFVEKEGWGICVDPRNPKAIADAVNSLVQDPFRLKRMSANAKQRFDEEYCMEVQGERLIHAMTAKGLL
jgi:glycosyltransferase involved in cell wall biosynthesis